jgi:hypothetical protein
MVGMELLQVDSQPHPSTYLHTSRLALPVVTMFAALQLQGTKELCCTMPCLLCTASIAHDVGPDQWHQGQ